MAYLNKVMLIGNIGRDPEIRMAGQTGKKVVRFSLATTRRYRDNNGEQKEQTEWHTVVGWGKIAEIFEQLGVSKGSSLYVEGELTNRSWTDQTTGQKRFSTEVNIANFQLLTPRSNSQGGNSYGNGGTTSYSSQNNPYSKSNQQQQQPTGFGAMWPGDEADDLPFDGGSA